MTTLAAILGELYFHACALDDLAQAYVKHEPVYRVAVGVKAVVILARHIPDGDAWRTATAEVTAYLNGLDLSPWTDNPAPAGIARRVGILKDQLACLQPYTVRAIPEAPTLSTAATDPEAPREYTLKETRTLLLKRIHGLVTYWCNESRAASTRDKLDGLAFSILSTLDGGGELPRFTVSPDPHPDDRASRRDDGENWFPSGGDLGFLHEFFHAAKDAPSP